MRNGIRSQQFLLCILSIALSVAFPSAGLAEPVPANLQGSWSRNCKDLGTNSVNIDSAAVTVVVKGKRHVYKGIDISRTWFGGAKATGDTIWLLMGKRDGKEFEFIIAATPGKQGFLVLEEGNPDRGQEIRSLFGKKLLYCGSRTSMDAGKNTSSRQQRVQKLDVPIMEQAGDGQMANCASSIVAGLKAGGDGFLAVRSGPGAEYRKLDELHNGDVVFVFEMRGKWAGVAYRTETVSCSSTKARAITYEKKGWVHSNWLKDLAG